MDDESSSSTPLYMKMLLASLVYVVSSACAGCAEEVKVEEGWSVWRDVCVCEGVAS